MNPSTGPEVHTLASYLGVPSTETVIAVIVTVVFIWWAVFSVVVAYHLMRYARDSWLTIPVLVLHVAVSAWLFIFATGGFH